MTDLDVKGIIGDIVNHEYEGRVKAVGVIAVLADGDMRVTFAAPEGTKTQLLTAAAILHRDLLAKFETVKK